MNWLLQKTMAKSLKKKHARKKTKKINCDLCGSKEYNLLYDCKKDGVSFKVVRCLDCNLVYQNPIDVFSDIEEYYDEEYYSGEGYDTNISYFQDLEDQEVKKVLDDERIDTIQKISRKKKGNMLEIGCAFGTFLKHAKDRGWNVTGVELSKFSSEHGKKLNKIKILQGTIEEQKLPSNKFDVVSMVQVIEHLPSPTKTLNEINRIMKKGGILIVDTANIESIISKLKGKDWSYIMLGHLVYFSPETMNKYFKKTGFKLVKQFTGEDYSLKKIYEYEKKLGSPKHILAKNCLRHVVRKIKLGNLHTGKVVYYAKKVK